MTLPWCRRRQSSCGFHGDVLAPKKTRLNLDPALPKGVEMVGDTGGGGAASSNDGLAHR